MRVTFDERKCVECGKAFKARVQSEGGLPNMCVPCGTANGSGYDSYKSMVDAAGVLRDLLLVKR